MTMHYFLVRARDLPEFMTVQVYTVNLDAMIGLNGPSSFPNIEKRRPPPP